MARCLSVGMALGIELRLPVLGVRAEVLAQVPRILCGLVVVPGVGELVGSHESFGDTEIEVRQVGYLCDYVHGSSRCLPFGGGVGPWSAQSPVGWLPGGEPVPTGGPGRGGPRAP